MRVFATDGSVVFDRFVYEPEFRGGVRVATGDLLRNFFAFEDSLRVGAFISAADVNGDGFADYAVTAGAGGGPRVALFDGKTGERLVPDFLAFDGAERTGFTVALGDFDGDGQAEIAVGQAAASSQVRIFTLAGVFRAETLVYEPTFTGGINLAVGDTDGNGRQELLTGAGPGGGPRVRALSLVGTTLEEVGNGFSFDSAGRSGVRVGSAVGATGRPSLYVGLAGRTRTADRGIPIAGDDTPFGDDYLGGIWVS